MPRIKKIFLRTLITLGILYLLICIMMYFFQEALIFHPKKLDPGFKFSFEQPFDERHLINVENTPTLHGLHFKTDSSKGLVFYLHGNAGALDTWGKAAKTYTDLGYDFFIMDYRSYGKSEGEITDETSFYDDLRQWYSHLKKEYPEDSIIIIGYSIGTGPAAMLASENNPRMLILQTPYYSLTDMMQHTYPFVPTFLLKYKFSTNEFIQKTKAPVVIFHGDADEIIYYGSSEKLKQHFKKGDTLITLKGLGHNGMNKDEEYKSVLGAMLSKYEPLAAKWYDQLILDWIEHTDHNLFLQNTKADKTDISWLFQGEVGTDTAYYFIFRVGHTVTDSGVLSPRYISDAWLYLDTLKRKVFEYDVATEKISEWKK